MVVYLGCSTIANSTAVNVRHMYLPVNIFISFGYTVRSGIVRSYGGFIFSSLRTLHRVLHSDCARSHPHPQCVRVLLPPHPPTLVTCAVLDDRHSDRCEVSLHCGFDSHFSDD